MSKDRPNPFDIRNNINKLLSNKYNKKDILNHADIQGMKSDSKYEEENYKYEFNLKPLELINYLKKYIIGQEEAINIIATKICTHFNRMSYEQNNSDLNKIIGGIKGNILMIGPTGVGKTYIIKLIADKIGVPFVKADATKFTETGYVGGDVEDLVRNLVDEAKGQIELAEYGIIYLDEIDKIASTKNSYGPDVSRTGVQRNLLKVMEESEVDLKNPMDIASQMEVVVQAQRTGKIEKKKISTKNILFVMSGAFQDLASITKKRIKTQSLGFQTEKLKNNKNESEIDYLKYVNRQDLIDYGFESEFVGRLPVIAILNNLDEQGLYEILKSKNSTVISSKKRDFLSYGITIEFEDKALKKIAKKANEEKIGARSLLSIAEQKFIHFEKKLPSTSIKYLKITEELIENPQKILDSMLIRETVIEIITNFQVKHGIKLTLTEEAINYINTESKIQNQSIYEFTKERLTNYEYGLKLLGQANLVITKEILQNNQKYLDNLIKKSYDAKKDY